MRPLLRRLGGIALSIVLVLWGGAATLSFLAFRVLPATR